MTDRDEWLAWRRGGIGGSDIAAILGLSSFGSPYTVWADKVGLLPPSETTERQQVGLDLEDAIARMFHRRTGLHAAGEQTWCTHRDEAWMRCTVDAFVTEGPMDGFTGPGLPAIVDAIGIGQWKTDGRRSFPDGVPPAMRAQVQWEMAVTDLPHAWLGVLHAGFAFEVYEVERDDDDIAFMVERAERFWHDHVLTGIPPEVDGHPATDAALSAVYPGNADLPAVELDGGIVAAWRNARAEAKRWADLEQGHAQQIRAALGDVTEGRLDGALVASWRPQTSRRIDTKRLRAEWPDVAEACTTETTSRVLREHKPKEGT